MLANSRQFIVDNLDADDVIDELIQAKILGRYAAQKVQLVGMTRVDKNRIIVDQLSIAGPGSLDKFCEILRRNKRQTFIAEDLEKRKEIESPIVSYRIALSRSIVVFRFSSANKQ